MARPEAIGGARAGVTGTGVASLPLQEGEALLVSGAQNWNEADRYLDRREIRSLQVLTTDGSVHLAGVEALAARGIRDAVALDEDRMLLTTGSDLVVIDLRDGSPTAWSTRPSGDLHELSATGEKVVVSNTAYDEVVVLGDDGAVRHRVSLAPFRHAAARPIAHARPGGGLLPVGPPAVHSDSFHVNQGELTTSGGLLALVHHIAGYRPFTHLGHRLTRHGGGGVLDLVSGETHELGLRAPHSLRSHPGGGFAVLDSGRSEAVHYDEDWSERRRWSTGGWGRGLAITDDRRWFVGVSATRRRYTRRGEENDDNWVVAFDDEGTELGRFALPHVEQVWSVRVVPVEFATRVVEAVA